MNRHTTEIKKQAHGSAVHLIGWRFCVKCSCGYVSRWFDVYRDAENDEADHVRLASEADAP